MIHKPPKLYNAKRWFLLLGTTIYLALNVVFLVLDTDNSAKIKTTLFFFLLFFAIFQLFGFLAAWRQLFPVSYLYAFTSPVNFVGTVLLTSWYPNSEDGDEIGGDMEGDYTFHYRRLWPLMVVQSVLAFLLCVVSLLWTRDLYRVRHSSDTSSETGLVH